MLHLQASKLGLGRNSGIISYYSNHQVVQFNYSPLVVTFVAQATANTGELMNTVIPSFHLHYSLFTNKSVYKLQKGQDRFLPQITLHRLCYGHCEITRGVTIPCIRSSVLPAFLATALAIAPRPNVSSAPSPRPPASSLVVCFFSKL